MATARASRVLCGTALRVADLDCMQTFNAGASTRGAAAAPLSTDVRLADVVAPVGHTQILARFDRAAESGCQGLSGAHTAVDRLAFAIARQDRPAGWVRLKAVRLHVDTTAHTWVHQRSPHVSDREGNRVELVCHDTRV